MRPRIRTLKPEFWGDADVCRLNRDARLTAIVLISAADDRGRLEYSAATIRGYAWPRDALSDQRVQRWIEEVVDVGIARGYEDRSWAYLWLPNFWRHQVINRPTESLLPPHPEDPYGDLPVREALGAFREDAVRTHGGLREDSLPHAQARVPCSISPSSSNPSTTTEGSEKRRASKPVDQEELPTSLPAALAPVAAQALSVLQAVHGERGGDEPTLRGVGLAMARFPNRDHFRVVRELEHWALAGTGQRKTVKDWARTFATFLERAPAGAPVRIGSNGNGDGAGRYSEYDKAAGL